MLLFKRASDIVPVVIFAPSKSGILAESKTPAFTFDAFNDGTLASSKTPAFTFDALNDGNCDSVATLPLLKLSNPIC